MNERCVDFMVILPIVQRAASLTELGACAVVGAGDLLDDLASMKNAVAFLDDENVDVHVFGKAGGGAVVSGEGDQQMQR